MTTQHYELRKKVAKHKVAIGIAAGVAGCVALGYVIGRNPSLRPTILVDVNPEHLKQMLEAPESCVTFPKSRVIVGNASAPSRN